MESVDLLEFRRVKKAGFFVEPYASLGRPINLPKFEPTPCLPVSAYRTSSRECNERGPESARGETNQLDEFVKTKHRPTADLSNSNIR